MKFGEKFNLEKKNFICLSGIPDKYINNDINCRKFISIKNFIYVGTLIKRKFPKEVLISIYSSFINIDFKLNYVGEGVESSNIRKIILKKDLVSKVSLLGKISRNQVIEILKSSDVFVMISREEAFGLVYIEAMMYYSFKK